MLSNKKENTKNFKYGIFQNLKYVISRSWEYSKVLFIYFAVYTMIYSMSPFIGLFFPKFTIDELSGSQRLEVLAFLIISFFVLSSLVGYLIEYLKAKYQVEILKVRFQFLRAHQEKCMTTNYENTENPAFLNDMETAIRAISSNTVGLEGVFHKLFSLGGSILTFVLYSTIVVRLNPIILLYLVLTVIVSYLLTFKVRKYEHSKKDEISDLDRRSFYVYDVMSDFSYGKEIRIYNIKEWLAGIFKNLSEKSLKIYALITNNYLNISLADLLMVLIREGIIYVYLIYLVINGELTIGNFTLYFGTIGGLAGWMKTVVDDISHIRAQNLYINDLRNFLEYENKVDIQNPLPVPQAPYTIEFRDVSFKYPGSEQYVIQNLSLKIPWGKRLAIVGANGAGKTTFVKLLCGFYEPDDGEILLNGININRFKKKDYVKAISVVFQQVNILAFSVLENVTLKEDDIDIDKLMSCIKKSGMYNKISSLKNGVNTSMLKILDNEGIEFSGGENQRIALARALYKNGDIMILDEPTAALDPIAEYELYKNFDEIIEDKPVIYISHRLASTRFCDKIAMFENGRLIEYGSHTELVNKRGKYAEMYNIQAQYYNDSGEKKIEESGEFNV